MTSWLSNPTYYKHIRTLYQNDRIRVMDGDLTGEKTMTSIGVAAHKLGLTVEVLYLSNAEEYYRYTPQYAANLAGLPALDTSIALRTIYNKQWEHADSLWNYQVQPLLDYQTRLQNTAMRSRNAMLRLVEQEKALERTTDTKGLSRIAMPAPAQRAE